MDPLCMLADGVASRPSNRAKTTIACLNTIRLRIQRHDVPLAERQAWARSGSCLPQAHSRGAALKWKSSL